MRDESITTNQAANHPEADLLAAFVEKSLAGAERTQIVDHLAGCARCREIVFLAQQAAPAAEPNAASLPQNAPTRRLWKLPWLPVAASGLAVCLLAGSLVWFRSLHHSSSGTETAKVQSEPQPMLSPATNTQAQIVRRKAPHPAPRKALPAAPKAHPAEALHGSIAGKQAPPNSTLPAQETVAASSTGQLQAAQAYRQQAEAKQLAVPSAGAATPANGFVDQSPAAAPVPAAPSQALVPVNTQAVITRNATQAAGVAPSHGTVAAFRSSARPIALSLPGGHATVSSFAFQDAFLRSTRRARSLPPTTWAATGARFLFRGRGRPSRSRLLRQNRTPTQRPPSWPTRKARRGRVRTALRFASNRASAGSAATAARHGTAIPNPVPQQPQN